jgi:hypothetical protein
MTDECHIQGGVSQNFNQIGPNFTPGYASAKVYLLLANASGCSQASSMAL